MPYSDPLAFSLSKPERADVKLIQELQVGGPRRARYESNMDGTESSLSHVRPRRQEPEIGRIHASQYQRQAECPI